MGGLAKISPSGGGWTEVVVNSFSNDGYGPYAGASIDSNGNVYVPLAFGGTARCYYGCGAMSMARQTTPGIWKEKVVFDFPGFSLWSPLGLTVDSRGNVYGVAGSGVFGGTSLYQLKRDASGTWQATVLFDFSNSDVQYPTGGLTEDAAGNLYGTSTYGGTYGWGTVFELSPGTGGLWTEQTLYSFDEEGTYGSGTSPNPHLAIDPQGNLFGTTAFGGFVSNQCPDGCGIVFKLTKQADNTWSRQTIHTFLGYKVDGAEPKDGVIVDSAGNVYGTTVNGGGQGEICSAGTNILYCGIIYKLAPHSDGSYTETILHSFANGADGGQPSGRLLADRNGNLYGTTTTGGDGSSIGSGVVFKLTP